VIHYRLKATRSIPLYEGHMMANEKHLHKEKVATSETLSKQSRTRTFLRQKIKEPAKRALARTKDSAKEFGRLVLKHPKTALAATAITVMLLTPAKTSAQDVSGETENTSETISTKLDSNSINNVTVGLSNGIASIIYGHHFMFGLDVKKQLIEATGKFDIKPEDVIAVKNVFLDGKPMSYQIFKTGVVVLGIDASAGTSQTNGLATRPQGSKIEMNEGEYIIASNGAMFIATKNDAGEYVGLLGVVPGKIYSTAFANFGPTSLKSVNFQEKDGTVYLNETGGENYLSISIWKYHLDVVDKPPVTSSGR
jgi:hypothetical protein